MLAPVKWIGRSADTYQPTVVKRFQYLASHPSIIL